MENYHELKTVAEIRKVVTPENIDNFIVDFKAFIALGMLVDTIGEITNGDVQQKEPDTFKWIDDGKNNIESHVHVISTPPPAGL